MSRACELFMCDEAPGCMVDGDPAAPVLVVAMAPGREELQADKPLVGASGKMLWNQLVKKAGISRADCYIINTIGEWPDGATGGPSAAQFAKWWDVFADAARVSKAKVALLLGGDALWRFTGLTGIEDWRGYLIGPDNCEPLTATREVKSFYKTNTKKHRKGDPKIERVRSVTTVPWPETVATAIATFHPAAILRTGLKTLPVFSADVARLGRALRGDLKLTLDRWSPYPVGNLPKTGPVTIDIETGGINHDTITRIGAMQTEAWTSPWDSNARTELLGLLAHARPSVAFNISFDAPRLEANGVPVPEPWWDVMLAAAVLKPDIKKSLNFVASLYLDTTRWKHLSDEDPAYYNALDVIQTHKLYHVLRAELERTGQLHRFEQRMMPTLPTLVRMTRRGIMVDQQAKSEWIEQLSREQVALLARWERLAPGIKTSGKGLINFLYRDLGVPIQYQKHGGVTSEVAAIKSVLVKGQLDDNQKQTLETLLELRGVQKELRTYAEIEVDGDGCIHPGFLPAGKDEDAFGKGLAGTGRITASNPNIQNQPESARRMYIPHGDDSVLIEADFSQIEARIIAQLSGDDELKAAIAEGLHESNQKAMGVDKTRAKNGFYGWAYGAGKRTLSRTFISRGYHIPERECEALLRGFDRRFAKAAAWRRQIAAEVSTRYYLSNPFGARRYFMGGSRDVPAGLDYLPQSCAADIMWTILRPLEEQLSAVDCQLLATIHDSVLVEVPGKNIAYAVLILREVMEQPWPELDYLSVPIDLKIGANWGEMRPLSQHS